MSDTTNTNTHTSTFAGQGRVRVGFSHPYIANYSASSGVITLSNPTKLCEGVSVSVTPNQSGDNEFYADNVLSEKDGGTFTGGTFTLDVKGLKVDAERKIMGVTAPSTGDWDAYDDDQSAPYLALGYIVEYIENGAHFYVPTILVKTMFNPLNESATTQGASISYQSESLSGSIFRGDDTKHTWKWRGNQEYTTVDLAKTALLTKMGQTG